MPALPSINGFLLSSIVKSILKLVSAGQMSRDELERRFEPGDLQILDSKILLAQWQDIRWYERLVKLLLDIEVRPRPEASSRRLAQDD